MALKQGSISQIRKGELTKSDGYLVITMCFYPRGLKKVLFDEYRANLAPQRELLHDFKEAEAQWGHEEAFSRCRYEERFDIQREAFESLRRLVDQSKKRDVYFICQCELGQKCHRELLLMVARDQLGAPVDSLFHKYPVFTRRIPTLFK